MSNNGSEGAILVKSDDNINIIAIGKYETLERRLEYYCKLTGSLPTKLVNVTGMDIQVLILDQTKINEAFAADFS